MNRPGRAHWPAQAMAWIAVALLTLASAQSIVMRAVADGPASLWPVCAVAADKSTPHGPSDPADHQICSICAAASCAPLTAEGPRPSPPLTVAWSPWRPALVHFQPYPPTPRPKARGPPPSPAVI